MAYFNSKLHNSRVISPFYIVHRISVNKGRHTIDKHTKRQKHSL